MKTFEDFFAEVSLVGNKVRDSFCLCKSCVVYYFV